MRVRENQETQSDMREKRKGVKVCVRERKRNKAMNVRERERK